MSLISTVALDLALDYIDAQATILHICSAEPTVYGTLNSLGNKTSPVISASGAGAGTEREIGVSAITDGTVTGTGTADSWCLVSGSELLAAGQLDSSQAVTSGNTFTLDAFDIALNQPT